MTTWTFRAALAGAALAALAACEEGQGGGLSLTAAPAAKVEALSQAKMAFGAVTLVPPRGYCIDKASLRQNFALMAPCGQLGAKSSGGDAPAGLLIASLAPLRGSTLPTAEHTAAAQRLESTAAPRTRDGAVTFRATGPVPAKGYSTRHWRGTGTVGTQIISVALFGAPGGRATGSEGRSVVRALIAATANAS